MDVVEEDIQRVCSGSLLGPAQGKRRNHLCCDLDQVRILNTQAQSKTLSQLVNPQHFDLTTCLILL